MHNSISVRPRAESREASTSTSGLTRRFTTKTTLVSSSVRCGPLSVSLQRLLTNDLAANANATVAALSAYQTVVEGGESNYVAEGALSMYYEEGRNFETGQSACDPGYLWRPNANGLDLVCRGPVGLAAHDLVVSLRFRSEPTYTLTI
jgi:hypothetical protein